jgi:hypothetical protein
LSLSRSPALAPCGIPDDPDPDEPAGVEVAGAAGGDVVVVEDPELPQPTTARQTRTSAAPLANRRFNPDVALSMMCSPFCCRASCQSHGVVVHGIPALAFVDDVT